MNLIDTLKIEEEKMQDLSRELLIQNQVILEQKKKIKDLEEENIYKKEEYDSVWDNKAKSEELNESLSKQNKVLNVYSILITIILIIVILFH